MKSLVLFALVVILDTLAVQGYGPRVGISSWSPPGRGSGPVGGGGGPRGGPHDGPGFHRPGYTRKPPACRKPPTTTTTKPTTTTEKPTTTTEKPTTTTPSRPTCPTDKPCDREKTTKSIPETTPSNPEPETTTAGEITPQIQACINSCHSTPEYNPVCGSNGITYENEGKLFCAKSCGVKVTLRRRSVCRPPTWDDNTDDTTLPGTPPPTITDPPPVGRTTSLSDFQRCMRLCSITPSFTPVCGTDFVTYMNIDRLKCAQKCGQDVKVLCEKPCAACGITPGTPKTTTTITTTSMRPTTTPQIGRSTLAPDVQKCIKTCPVTAEYNPVCGSDHVTYSNPSRLMCAQMCGTDVKVLCKKTCAACEITPGTLKTTTTITTTTMRPTTTPQIGRSTLAPDVQKCIKTCPVTAEYNPVCGSDHVTYSNPSRLMCAQMCGNDVKVLCEKTCAACEITPGTLKTTTTMRPTTTPQIGRSTLAPDVQKCIKTCPVTAEYNPVCGSDRVTYSNPGRLICAQMCGTGVRITRMGPCGSTTTMTTTSTTVAPTSTRSPAVSACIRRCPVTSEYDPVCGTDGLTYTNLGNLQCSKYCGVAVHFKYKSRCIDEFDLGGDGTTEDINGNKNKNSDEDEDLDLDIRFTDVKHR